MINEKYVTLETAELLKQAGFPQFPIEPDGTQRGVPCIKCYTRDGLLTDWIFQRGNKKACSAPTQALAMRWLRDEHKISVEPSVTLDMQWCCSVWDYTTIAELLQDGLARFSSYEIAAEAGIQAACNHLIKEGGN